MKKIEENTNKAANFLKGMASPRRLAILCLLAEGEKNVSELVKETETSQTSLSQHLGKMRAEKIVTYRRDSLDHGTLYYSIDSEEVIQIMKVLYNKFCYED